MNLHTPHLLFLGDVKNPLDAKTARGMVDWRPDHCVGQLRLPGCEVDLGLPDLTPAAAYALGARSLVVGVAPLGGQLAPEWLASMQGALREGLSLVSGLHQRLVDIPALASEAMARNLALIDVRVPPGEIAIATGETRTGKRLLTVGTDCCVGKKYTALALARALTDEGMKATFRATGQTGIMISGQGIPMDAVISDFLSGAAEQLSPNADHDHWDIIEGQGSLFHPAYAAVTLGLLHGSQPDALVLCHDVSRTTIDEYEAFPIPDIKACVRRYEEAAQLTNAAARVVGISLITSASSDAEALVACEALSQSTGLLCFDPLRHAMTPLISSLLS
ncbi:DUF1611 domain-containing protein [Luminiphilus sp.]|nr:DUF1611 domain-containing protein [Luminiphilus sp.]